MNKPESLQEFTDSSNNMLDKPTNLEELSMKLNKQFPQPSSSAPISEHKAHRDAIINGILNSELMNEEGRADLRTQVWERNHTELIEVMSSLMSENGRMPTVSELAFKTGLSRMTVHKHLKEFIQVASYQAQLQQFQLMSSEILVKLFNCAIRGDVKAAKIYLEAVGSLPGLDHSVTMNKGVSNSNYIQVNNNVKIDQMTFATLPENVQQQITDLVLQGQQHPTSTAL